MSHGWWIALTVVDVIVWVAIIGILIWGAIKDGQKK